MSTYGKRRKRLVAAASNYDTVLVTDPKNLFYLTDFWGGGIGIVRDDRTILVTSVMEQKRANDSGQEVEVIPTKGRKQQYEAVQGQVRGRTLVDEFDPKLDRATVDADLFLGVRRKKDEEEIARITKASKAVDRIYGMLETSIAPGRTERQVAADVMKVATEEKLTPLPSEGALSPVIIGSGPNGSYPHADLSDRKIRTGDMVVADIFFRHRGYCTDCTRTFAVGRVSPEKREVYQAVLESQLKGIELATRGTACRAVHNGVNEVLKLHNLDSYFTHGVGHGVGIDIHESPSLNRSSVNRLRQGDVVTIEPGVYFEGMFGIRIEDTLVVGDRTKVLSGYTKELRVVG